MILFTKDKYIPTNADVFQLSVEDEGYVLISKDVYDALLDVQTRGTVTELSEAFEVKHTEASRYFLSKVPAPLDYLVILFDRLTFEPELNLEVLFGICSAILAPMTFTCIVEQGYEQFKLREYSEFILKEYTIPRKVFLTSCIPYEQLLNPEVVPNKINILVLGNGAPVASSIPQLGNYQVEPTQSFSAAASSSNDPDKYEYYIARKNDYVYFGDGVFISKADGSMVECDVYDDAIINEAFGVKPVEPLTAFSNPGQEEVEVSAPAAVAATSDDAVEDMAARQNASTLFAKTRAQRA